MPWHLKTLFEAASRAAHKGGRDLWVKILIALIWEHLEGTHCVWHCSFSDEKVKVYKIFKTYEINSVSHNSAITGKLPENLSHTSKINVILRFVATTSTSNVGFRRVIPANLVCHIFPHSCPSKPPRKEDLLTSTRFGDIAYRCTVWGITLPAGFSPHQRWEIPGSCVLMVWSAWSLGKATFPGFLGRCAQHARFRARSFDEIELRVCEVMYWPGLAAFTVTKGRELV